MADDRVNGARLEIERDPSAKSWGQLCHSTIMHSTATHPPERCARTPGHAADRAVSWQAILPTSVRRLGSLQFVSRYVILVANDPDLLDNVRGTLLRDGRFIDAGDMIHCDGSAAPLTNTYPIEMTAADWAGWNSGSNPGPDVRTASTLLFECRSASWVAEVSSLLAENLAVPIWLVDSAGNVWPAASVDPERIKLD